MKTEQSMTDQARKKPRELADDLECTMLAIESLRQHHQYRDLSRREIDVLFRLIEQQSKEMAEMLAYSVKQTERAQSISQHSANDTRCALGAYEKAMGHARLLLEYVAYLRTVYEDPINERPA